MTEQLISQHPQIDERPTTQNELRSVDIGESEHSEAVVEFFGGMHPLFSRALLYLLLVFVAVALLWAGLGKVDIVARSPFRLVPLGKANTVQAPRGGEIEQILVKEGDQVEAEQVLFRLRSKETWTELGDLEQARVRFLNAKYELQEALPKQQQLVRKKIVSLKDRLMVMQTLMDAHQVALDALYKEDSNRVPVGVSGNDLGTKLEAEVRFRSEELAYFKQQYEGNKKLYEKHLISRATRDEARVKYLSGLAVLPARMMEIHRMETTVQDLQRQILEAQIQLNREEISVRNTYEETRLRYERAQQAVDRALDFDSDLILAPETGVITQVYVNTIGQVTDKGQTLVTLASATAPMVAEARISEKDVGLVKPGQLVRLKYDAFPFDRYGIQRGRLVQIAPDATTDVDLAPIYRGVVELEEVTVWVKGEARPLMYGMKGSAEIVTDRQTVLGLLLQPLRQLRESVRFVSEKEE